MYSNVYADTVKWTPNQKTYKTRHLLEISPAPRFTVHCPNKNPRKNAIENVRLLYIYRISGP